MEDRTERARFFSRDVRDYFELLVAGGVLFVLFIVLKISGAFNIAVGAGSTPGALSVFLIGLAAGTSTCMGMIGGLVLGISSRYAKLHPEATTRQKFEPHIFFNIGRFASYVLLGGAIGLIGSVLRMSSPVLGGITALIGAVMLVIGLKLTGIFPKLENVRIMLPKVLSEKLGIDNEKRGYSHTGAFVTGALTFFVPCGFTQAMQLYAVSTGSFFQGAFIMGLFALGTLPAIAGIGGLASIIKGWFASYFFRFAGLIVIALALFNITGGFRLLGISGLSFPNRQGALAVIDAGAQVVNMTESDRGYFPNRFTVKKGIPVVWHIKSTSQYTCASTISMPGAGILKTLSMGDNVIEFTPQSAGELAFTCSMGMYPGSFTVID